MTYIIVDKSNDLHLYSVFIASVYIAALAYNLLY